MNTKIRTEAIIGAGTCLSFEDPASPGGYLELEEARTIGATGTQGEFVETTPLKATTRTYIPGLKTRRTRKSPATTSPATQTRRSS